MHNIGNISLVAGLIYSSSVIAAMPAMDHEIVQPVTSENTKGGFYISLTGNYLQPHETGTGLIIDSWQYQQPSGAVESTTKPFDPNHELEYGFGLGYDFGHSQNNLEFNYMHLSNDSHIINDSTGSPYSFGSLVFTDVTVFDPIGLIIDANLRYTLDEYALMFGHTYSSDNFDFKPKLGIEYASLKHKLTFVVPDNSTANSISNFSGIGPAAGLDTHYSINKHFGLVGGIDAALLVGTIKSSSYLNVSAGFINDNFSLPSTDRVVPKLSAKVGIDFNYVFSNKMSINIETGYKAAEYYNSVDLIQAYILPIADIVPIGGPKIADVHTNSFSYSGPYITMTLHA